MLKLDHRELRNSKGHKMGLSAHCRVIFVQADLRFGFLRLSTIKNCPHMLKSDHRGLRISEGKFLWWVVVGGGWYEVTTGTVLI